MRRKTITISLIILFLLVIFIPPIAKGYVYPNISDDTAYHLEIFDRMVIGEPVLGMGDWSSDVRYFGVYIIGYPLDALNQLFGFSKDAVFMWFNYLAFAMVGLTLCYVMTKLIGWKAGLLSLIIPIFTAYGVLQLTYTGQVFNLINVAVILPWAVYLTAKWVETRRWRWGVGAISVFALFSIFHTSGIYLLYIALGYLFFYCLYLWKRRRFDREAKVNIGFLSVVVVMSFVLSRFNASLSAQESIWYYFLHPEFSSLPLADIVIRFVTLPVFVMFIVAGYYVLDNSKKLATKEKTMVLLYLAAVLTLLPPAIVKMSLDAARQGIDWAILVSILTVGLVGLALKYIGLKRMQTAIVVFIILASSFAGVWEWVVGYNSAITPADIQAIRLMNWLDGETYSSSTQVAHWVYDRYVGKDWVKDGSGDVVVYRSMPMTPAVTSVNDFYWTDYVSRHEEYADNDALRLVATYTDDKRDSIIEVYRRVAP